MVRLKDLLRILFCKDYVLHYTSGYKIKRSINVHRENINGFAVSNCKAGIKITEL